MDFAKYLGLIAGAITTSGFIPQVIKVITTKKAHDVALMQPVVLSIGIVLWLIYGIMQNDIVLIVANSMGLFLNLLLLVLKFIYD